MPDATTLLKFRRLLQDNQLTQAIFERVNAHLGERGLLMREGTLVDATIIGAPPSTKNKDHARDPEMHQTKKGKQWHFGMKVHIGVDAESGLAHSVHVTAANESDVAHTHELLHGQEERAHADAGYTGVDKREKITEAQKEGDVRQHVKWLVATKRGVIKAMVEGPLKELTVLVERKKAQVPALVEHPFHVVTPPPIFYACSKVSLVSGGNCFRVLGLEEDPADARDTLHSCSSVEGPAM